MDFAYTANLKIATAAYGVLLLDLLLRYQMIANRRKTRNSHLIDTRNQNQSYGTCIEHSGDLACGTEHPLYEALCILYTPLHVCTYVITLLIPYYLFIGRSTAGHWMAAP